MTFKEALKQKQPDIVFYNDVCTPFSSVPFLTIKDLIWSHDNIYTYTLIFKLHGAGASIRLWCTEEETDKISVTIKVDSHENATDVMLQSAWDILSDICGKAAKNKNHIFTDGAVDPNKMTKIATALIAGGGFVKVPHGELRKQYENRDVIIVYKQDLPNNTDRWELPADIKLIADGHLSSFEYDKILESIIGVLGENTATNMAPLHKLPDMINKIDE